VKRPFGLPPPLYYPMGLANAAKTEGTRDNMGITIIGLGPGDPELLTRKAWEELTGRDTVYARTAEHPVLDVLPSKITVITFDDVYAHAPTFQAVYTEISRRIIALAEEKGDILYAVPGHPRVGEATTPLIEQEARKRGIPVHIIGGLSFVDEVCNAVGLDPLNGLTVYDAMLVAGEYFPRVNTDFPLLLGQLYSRELASDVKLTLLAAYPPDHRVTLVQNAGTPDERIWQVPLVELDRTGPYNHMTTLVVPPWSGPSAYETFQNVINHLRSPEGCPWDRKQTHRSLRRHLLEETYEVLAALDRDDPKALKEELGDLLLQIGLHVAIATEGGDFLLGDVIQNIVEKLIRRHPHVFGDVHVKDADEVARNWEAIKKQERAEHGKSDHPLADIPQALPALLRADTVAKRLHWQIPAPPRGLDPTALEQLGEEELGDLLFWLAAWSRERGWDPEMLLREATERAIEKWYPEAKG